jgi:hypothetical protein
MVSVNDPKRIALRFNDYITSHDLDGLARLMADDHVFIDRDGTAQQPKPVMLGNWKRFFDAFPEYKNIFIRVEARDDRVVMLGYAYWSQEKPHDPAIWTATVVDGLVREWRIYDDTPENRKGLGLV